MTRWAIAADLNRCVGCQTCTAACKQANATAPSIQWRKVLDFEAGEFPDVSRAFVPVGCMHCDNPPCLDVCPSTATRKRDDGIVTIDYDVCIGCSYCAVACPYQARFRVDTPNEAYGTHLSMDHEVVRENWDRRAVAQKCTFCVQRIDPGIAANKKPGIDPEATPACVNACIAGALEFGDLDDPNSNVSTLLRENHYTGMHEELGTGPGIFYLWERGEDDGAPTEPAEMLREPVGAAMIAPTLQTQWDWRAAANFIFGGTGTGLFAAAVLGSFLALPMWFAAFLALAFVGTGLFCVFLEIGRPWRFLNVYRNMAASWMTREAFAAIPFFGFGGLAWLFGSLPLAVIAAGFGIVFLYCQGRILLAAKGIPAWRQVEILPLIISAGLAEGAGAMIVVAFLLGAATSGLQIMGAVLAGLALVRYLFWAKYRKALGSEGAPTETFRALDNGFLSLSLPGILAILVLVAGGMVFPLAFWFAGVLTVATGWAFKFTLITKAAFNQGYAINHMPARGAGKSLRGIKPGWMVS